MKALIVVDYQYDFADPNGSLYWPEGETLKEGIEQKIKFYKDNNWLVVYTMDWHPENHCSFEIWPPHCIQNTKGAQILVDTSKADFIVKKAVKIDEDSYSGFNFQVEGVAPLEEWLRDNQVNEVEICGLVKQYCVDATYQDALKHGFKATIIESLVK